MNSLQKREKLGFSVAYGLLMCGVCITKVDHPQHPKVCKRVEQVHFNEWHRKAEMTRSSLDAKLVGRDASKRLKIPLRQARARKKHAMSLSPTNSSPKVLEASGLRSPSQARDLSPAFKRPYFSCPSCGVAASQNWLALSRKVNRQQGTTWRPVDVEFDDLAMCVCGASGCRSLWFEQQRIYPRTSDAPAMSPDMPEGVRKDYEEAAAIASESPRAAAALLRMCIEGLCKDIAEKPKFDIALDELARRGIPEEIQTAIDVIRMNGNEVMHAGRLYGTDDAGTVAMLFKLANVIVTWAITDRKLLRDLYTQIPETKRESVEKRRAEARAKGVPMTPTPVPEAGD